MKIIDNKKDFYDFLVGKYGIDEKIIFDRKNSFPVKPKIIFNLTSFSEEIYYRNKKFKNFLIHYILLIGDEIIHIFVSENMEIFTHFNIEKIIFDNFKNESYVLKNGKEYKIFTNFSFLFEEYRNKNFSLKNFEKLSRNELLKNFLEKINFEEIPIIFIKNFFKFKSHGSRILDKEDEIVFLNPNLQNLGIFLDPDFVWQNIYNFLLKIKTEKENYHEAKNDEKIFNKGFDLKTSFRPKMKNRK